MSSPVKAFPDLLAGYETAMRSLVVILFVVGLVLAIVPGWTATRRIDLFDAPFRMTSTRVPLDPLQPARTRVGRLQFLGGIALAAPVPAFGGFSGILVQNDRFTLQSDGGTVLQFRMGDDWHVRDAHYLNLPGGPGTGWEKADRDSESVTTDPATGRIWAGFERWNAIGRFSPDLMHLERLVAPRAMANWPTNGGPESMVRLADGRFVVISETARPAGGPRGGRDALVFARDPTVSPRPRFHFVYRPPRHFDPSDVTELPDGRLLVLDRRFQLPFRWSAKLVIVVRNEVRPGRQAIGHEVATLAAPLTSDNYEGVAVTHEAGATNVWLVSDDNQLSLQRTLLMKFRLDPDA